MLVGVGSNRCRDVGIAIIQNNLESVSYYFTDSWIRYVRVQYQCNGRCKNHTNIRNFTQLTVYMFKSRTLVSVGSENKTNPAAYITPEPFSRRYY